jgi:hypothetical protein
MAKSRSNKKKAKKRTVSTPKLKVMFDTNVLYTKLAHHLFRLDVKELVASNSTHPDLTIEWYLPDVVARERQYQMSQQASRLHESVAQLEKLVKRGDPPALPGRQ